MISTDCPTTVGPVCSLVVPAHDEERGIARLLDALVGEFGEFQVVVVANGCHDRTAEVARGYAPDVSVVETPVPSKASALRLGDQAATAYPRLYVDADVVIGAADVRALCAALTAPGRLAAAPSRHLPMDDASFVVRAYYRTWTRLPQVRSGLFGRGVIAMTREGHDRVSVLPAVMSDDLAISEAFTPGESVVVAEATVTILPPRTLKDLMRRRVRVATGVTQLDRSGGVAPTSRTSLRTLIGLARSNPLSLGDLGVFVGVTVATRLAAMRRVRSGDFTTWLRDESSRAAV